jgi:hypothetical protein
MFGRADREAAQVRKYAQGVSLALKVGIGTIGSWRTALLAKADEVDAGPLHVTDTWVVLIDEQIMTGSKPPRCTRWRWSSRTSSTACSSRWEVPMIRSPTR